MSLCPHLFLIGLLDFSLTTGWMVCLPHHMFLHYVTSVSHTGRRTEERGERTWGERREDMRREERGDEEMRREERGERRWGERREEMRREERGDEDVLNGEKRRAKWKCQEWTQMKMSLTVSFLLFKGKQHFGNKTTEKLSQLKWTVF